MIAIILIIMPFVILAKWRSMIAEKRAVNDRYHPNHQVVRHPRRVAVSDRSRLSPSHHSLRLTLHRHIAQTAGVPLVLIYHRTHTPSATSMARLPWKAFCPCEGCPRASNRPFRAESWEALYDQLAFHAFAADHDAFWNDTVKARLRANSGPDDLITIPDTDTEDDDPPAAPLQAAPAIEVPPRLRLRLRLRRKKRTTREARRDSAMLILDELERDIINAVRSAKTKLRRCI